MSKSIADIIAKLSSRLGFERDAYFIAVGALIGTLTGLGAVGFGELLKLTEDFVHLTHTEGPIWLLIVVPAIGMGLTGILTNAFAREAQGHGVPQVINALIRKGGVIPLRIGIVKVAASILTVGSGGSAGTEGPIVQIGATVGSQIGKRFRVSREQMGTLVGCGAAAGISAIFNAPIAGVFFVLEILLRDFSVKTFTPIVVASVFAAVTRGSLLGEDGSTAIFAVSESVRQAQFLPQELPSYLVLGLICGCVAVGFNKLLHYGEDVSAGIKLHPLLKPIAGAVLLGILGIMHIGLVRWAGQDVSVPAFFGNGYETIRHLIDPAGHSAGEGTVLLLGLLALLVILKGVATTLTLASGGSGGVFAPSLFLGAAAGALVGEALEMLGLLPEQSTPAAYALVGMGAVVAGSTHAPLTAILILFELTQNIRVVLPIMLAAVVATVVAQLIERDSIYTFKLRRAGVRVGRATDFALLRRIPVSSVPRTPLTEDVYASDPVGKLVALHATHHVPDFVVVDQDGSYMGMVTGGDMRTALIDREAIPLLLVAEIVRTDIPVISPDENLETVMEKFNQHDVASLCLVRDGKQQRPLALITRADVMKRYQRALEES